MTRNAFNICPGCKHVKTCALTDLKEKVWYCSDFEESILCIHTKTNPLQTIR